MAVNGDRKGKTAERAVAKLCVEWWAPLEPEAEFVRTPQSGGWATPKLRGDFHAAGDLMTTAKRWPFTVEVKHRERFALKNVVEGKACPVWEWWVQCQTAAAEEYREPMLWFRKNKMPWFIMLRAEYAQSVRGLPPPDAAWTRASLLEVDYGPAVPVLYQATAILRVPPRTIAAKRGSVR